MSSHESSHESSIDASGPAGLQVFLYRFSRLLNDYVARLIPADLSAVIDSADIVQDVYLDAMRRAAEFRPNDDDHVRRWLKTIARNRTIDIVRHHRAAKRGGGAVAVSGTADADGSTVAILEQVAVYHRTPSQSAVAHEIAALVNQSINDLPPDYAKILRLRYLDGLSGKSAALQMDRTEPAIHALCSRAVAALRSRLQASVVAMG